MVKKKHTSKTHSKKSEHSTKNEEKSIEHIKKSTKKKPSTVWYKMPILWIIIIILILAIGLGIYLNDDTSFSNTFTGKVVLYEYTDFGCPFCAKAAGNLDQIKEEYGDAVEVEFKHFPIPQLHPQSQKAHESSECARDQGAFKEYHDWLFANQQKHDVANLKKAASDLGLDLQMFSQCLDSGEKESLVKADFNEGVAKGVSATPTFFINNKTIRGAQPIDKFRSMIDAELSGEVVETENIDLVILNDQRCVECDISALIPKLQEMFGTLNVTQVDYNTEEGKKIYEDNNIGNLPALLFDNNIVESEVYSEIQQYFYPQGEYLLLAIGSEHDPTKEICYNEVDDTGNGLVDCADADCADTLVCREEIEGNLQVFIMSDCPYGRKAIEALYEVVDVFGEDIDYEIHYIATETADGFRSLHGQYEVDENIIQLCVMDKSPEVSLDYLYCRSTKGVNGKDWQDCAEETGVDVEAVQTCFDSGEGADLLREDIKIAESLSISGSPTWLANNRYTFGGIGAETVKQNLCQYNDFDACDATLSESNGVDGSC